MNAHQLDAQGVILNTIVVSSLDVFPGLVDAAVGGSVGDSIINKTLVRKPPVAPTVAEYTSAIQAMLDTKCHERMYDNILSACTYATSTIDRFRAEGQAAVDWRDAVWARSYELMDQVQAGKLPQPTVVALIAMLPTMEWPA